MQSRKHVVIVDYNTSVERAQHTGTHVVRATTKDTRKNFAALQHVNPPLKTNHHPINISTEDSMQWMYNKVMTHLTVLTIKTDAVSLPCVSAI